MTKYNRLVVSSGSESIALKIKKRTSDHEVEPKKKLTAGSENFERPEKKLTAESEMYQAEPDKKQIAKRQRY